MNYAFTSLRHIVGHQLRCYSIDMRKMNYKVNVIDNLDILKISLYFQASKTSQCLSVKEMEWT